MDGYEPKDQCYQLIKPGDVDVPKEDRKMDEDNGRGEIRDSFAEQNVVIRTNVNDILHHGSYTSLEAVSLGLIDGTTSYANVYKTIIPELLGLDEKKVSYLYLHRYYQRVFKAKIAGGIPDIPGPDEGSFSIRKYIGGGSTKIAYIGATNGAIIDGDSTKDRIGSTTLWFVYVFSGHHKHHKLANKA